MQDTRNIDPVQIVTDIVNVCPNGIEHDEIISRFVTTLVSRAMINAMEQGKIENVDGRYFSVAAPVLNVTEHSAEIVRLP